MKTLISILSVIICPFWYCQKTNCTTIEKELQSNKMQVAELSKQINYYKETLNLLTPIRTVNVDGLEINITKIVGSTRDKSLSVIFVYQNKDSQIREFFQCEQAYLIDPQGNQFQTHDVFVAPNNGIRMEKITPNILAKGKITFKTIDPTTTLETTTPTIRILTLKVFAKNHIDSPYSAVFENIPISWE